MHELYEGRVGEGSLENVMPPFDQIETREVVTRTTPGEIASAAQPYIQFSKEMSFFKSRSLR